MRAWLDLYAVLTRVSIAMQIQYRASNVIWMIGGILEPLIYLVVWSTVAGERGGAAGGYEAADFAAYYITYLFVSQLTFSWVMHEFQYRVQTGEFSVQLLRPVHPIHGDLADNVAYKLVMLAVTIPAAVLLAIAFGPRFETTGAALALALPALLLGFAVRFLCEWTLALAAFWTTRVSAVNQIYFAVLMFLSGRVAPMAVLPDWLRELATASPFYWMLAFPIELIIGRVSPAEALAGLGAQAAWAAAALALLSLLWRRAVRRFSAVGS